MRAVEVTRFGGPDVLAVTNAPEPVPGEGQVLVEVSFADTLFLDTVLRRGLGQEWFPIQPPYIPGGGIAGIVRRVGPGADPMSTGQRVVALTHANGGYAEQAVAAADDLITVPACLEMATAAALVHDGRTAFALAESTGFRSGESILVLAAAGGLGLILVQLAHAAGARVIGAARGRRKLDAIRSLGAEHALDYSRPDWTTRLLEATGGRGPDVVFDGVGGTLGQRALDLVAPGGRISAHGSSSGRFATDTDRTQTGQVSVKGIEQAQLTAAQGRRMTNRALAATAAGRIAPVIGLTLPLEKAADAHVAIETRAVVGKTLLSMSSA